MAIMVQKNFVVCKDAGRRPPAITLTVVLSTKMEPNAFYSVQIAELGSFAFTVEVRVSFV